MSITRAVRDDGIAVITMDDGKVNAFDLDFFAALDAAFDEAADDPAVVLTGRPGMFSAGLNLKAMQGLDTDGLTELLVRFGQAMHRVWLEPRPVVAAVGGHAVAGGTILAMACDHAVAADGEYRWGLVETTIGFAMPQWIIALARGNVRADRLDDLLLPGRMVGPADAVECGYADVLAAPDSVVDVAVSRARELAELPRATYAETKRRLRGPVSEAVLAGAEEDLRAALAVGDQR